MITLNKYSNSLEEDFAEAALEVLGSKKGSNGTTLLEMLDTVFRNHSVFFPSDFKSLNEEQRVRKFVCLKYDDITEIRFKLDDHDHEGQKKVLEELGEDAEDFKECYKSIITRKTISHKRNRLKLAVRMTRDQNLRVCPYCNRNWITSRGNAAGVEMDHYVSKNSYPIFAVCMYNLVPCCGICNKIKSAKEIANDEIISPYDKNHNLSQEITFTYDPFEKKVLISGPKAHIENLQLTEGYELNDIEADELQLKIRMYSETQIKEIKDMMDKENRSVSIADIYKSIFGDLFEEDSVAKYPLGKMKADLFKQWTGFDYK